MVEVNRSEAIRQRVARLYAGMKLGEQGPAMPIGCAVAGRASEAEQRAAA